MAFTIKRNDRRPHYRVALTVNGDAIDLTDAQGIRFHMRVPLTGVVKVNAPATIVDAETGVVEYAWAEGDTDTSGGYQVEFEIDWGADETQTFPNDGYFIAKIIDDLA